MTLESTQYAMCDFVVYFNHIDTSFWTSNISTPCSNAYEMFSHLFSHCKRCVCVINVTPIIYYYQIKPNISSYKRSYEITFYKRPHNHHFYDFCSTNICHIFR